MERWPGVVSKKKAVALGYEPQKHNAPVVLAKGTGQVAQQITAKAEEAGVPVREDAALVELLSKLEIQQEIPEALYDLVAEILAFVYQAERAAREKRFPLGGKNA
jgi:flagellar biosynthesis protein